MTAASEERPHAPLVVPETAPVDGQGAVARIPRSRSGIRDLGTDPRRRSEPFEERILRSSAPAIAAAYVLVAVSVLVLLVLAPSVVGWAALVLVAVLGALLLLHDRAALRVAERRAEREASLARILQGLSRSVSPDAVVSGIVTELREASGADHAVVVRRVGAGGLLEATLVSGGAAGTSSTTRFSAELLRPVVRDGLDQAQAMADAVADRVRDAYGLAETISAPLTDPNGLLGALVLSRRVRAAWPAETRRLLLWAAAEVSAALRRAYAHEADAAGARIDPLTGLPNRRYFDELTAVLATGRRQSDALGILMVDVDHFKRLNDRYGHAVGDVVLRHVAGLLVSSVRDDDTPARYGGEEFVVVLRRATLEQAVEVAERIRTAVRDSPPAAPGIRERITVSVGVAVREPGTSLPGIVEAADRALYLAKAAGRDRVEVG